MSTLQIIYNFLAPYRKWVVRALVLTAVSTLISLAPPMVLKVLVDQVITLGRNDLFVPMLVLFAVTPLAATVLGFANNYVVSLIGDKLVLDMRRRLYWHLQSLPMKFFDRCSTGMVIERLMGDVNKVQRMVTTQTITLATDAVACVAALGAMMYLNARLTVLLMLVVPIYVLNARFFKKRIRRANEQLRGKMDQISSTIQERLAGAAVIKAFGQERTEDRRFAADAHEALRFGTQAHNYSVGFTTSANLIYFVGQTSIYVLGCYLIIDGQMTLGAVVAFTTYCVYLLSPAVRFTQISNMVERSMVSVRRIGELLDEQVEPPDKSDAIRVGRLSGRVDFEDLRFEYIPGQPVLRDINLHVPAGTTVALVGHTGCGKTTLISLLYRFYEPTGGRILFDGIDITTIARKDLRRNLAIVPQDPVLFEGTVRENIAYGWPDAPLEKVIKAARIAEVHEVITSLPDGYDSQLGGEGVKLSVGQKQRLVIARAVLTEPAILILDEATSALDSQSEQLLQKALQRVMRNRTCFVVAHRLSTIINADMIVVMDQGRILEVGRHDELLNKRDGHYRRLYLTQFAKVA